MMLGYIRRCVAFRICCRRLVDRNASVTTVTVSVIDRFYIGLIQHERVCKLINTCRTVFSFAVYSLAISRRVTANCTPIHKPQA